jgi:hypothetical protein
MLSWIIQATIISIVLIFLVHHLFNFFKSTLTVPKIKDLVNTPTQKYDNMFSIISKGNYDNNNLVSNTNSNTNFSDNYEYTMKDLLPKPENDMKSELKNFLKKQLNTNDSLSTNSTSISALDSMMSNSYSEFR